MFGICLDAEAIWVGRTPENLKKPVLLSHGVFAIHKGLALERFIGFMRDHPRVQFMRCDELAATVS